jgi:hypothetical protein
MSNESSYKIGDTFYDTIGDRLIRITKLKLGMVWYDEVDEDGVPNGLTTWSGEGQLTEAIRDGVMQWR